MKERDITIDILKGIGIFLMVYGHARAPFYKFVLVFHMALFFIASGYLFKEDTVSDHKKLGNFIIRKIKGLWLPYFITTAAFVIFNNFFVYINFYTTNEKLLQHSELEYLELGEIFSISQIVEKLCKAALFHTSTQLGGALWFLQTLFFVQIGFGLSKFVISKSFDDGRVKDLIELNIAIVLLFIGFFCHVKGLSLYGLDRVASVYILFYIGNVIHQYSIMKYLFKPCFKSLQVLVFLASFASLLYGYIIKGGVYLL